MVSAEARMYVARFPEEAGDLLKQIKKVRKLIRKSRGRRRQRGRTTPKNLGEAGVMTTGPDAAQRELQDRGQAPGGELAATRPERATKETTDTVSENKEGVHEDTPPDWGSSSAGEWPWGHAGRPSDRGDSPSHLAVRPNEPVVGERLRLIPNERWRGVQTVQAHMAKARADRALTQEVP